LGLKAKVEMSVNDIKALLALGENLLATAEKLPPGPDRHDALGMIRKLAAEIADRIDRQQPEIGLKTKGK
jgi:hypothetical protein